MSASKGGKAASRKKTKAADRDRAGKKKRTADHEAWGLDTAGYEKMSDMLSHIYFPT